MWRHLRLQPQVHRSSRRQHQQVGKVMNRRNFLVRSAGCALSYSLTNSAAISRAGASQSQESLRQKLSRDPLRPQYHLIPQSGFVGDPCAPRFFNGKYHVFYHSNFGGHGWGHATSSDLVHWEHLPIALSPTPGFYDSYGCFTGSVLPGTEVTAVIYAAVTKVPRAQETIRAEGLREVQCIATSTDPELRTWQKAARPVIDGPPNDLKVVGFRDPFAWKEGDAWYVGVGSGFPQLGGNVLLYRSSDARNFEYVHPLAQGTWNGKSFTNPVGSGEMWECPDFFPLGEKHVLIYSTEYVTYWEVGTYDKRELSFHPERKGFLDHGAYYAPKTMIDDKGRRILWGWIQEARSREEVQAAGWSGAVSLPRLLTIGPENQLRMEVPPELKSLRTNPVEIKNPRDTTELQRAQTRAVIHNRCGEILCTFKAGALDCGLDLLIGSLQQGLSLFKIENGVSIGRTPSIIVGDRTIELRPDSQDRSTLHIWIDGSIIELFVDSTQVMTVRSYVIPAGDQDIYVEWTGRAESLISLLVADTVPISSDRLTS
jgi:beta-fructofuranosidase